MNQDAISTVTEDDWFSRIVTWNDQRGLLSRGFSHRNEISFVIEEFLESTGAFDSENAREESLRLADMILSHMQKEVEPRHIVDCFADILVFVTGAIAKLGYNPTLVAGEVYKHINSRTGQIINGKFVKDSDVEVYAPDYDRCKL